MSLILSYQAVPADEVTELERYLAEHIEIPPGYELTDIMEDPFAGTPEKKEYILTFRPKTL